MNLNSLIGLSLGCEEVPHKDCYPTFQMIETGCQSHPESFSQFFMKTEAGPWHPLCQSRASSKGMGNGAGEANESPGKDQKVRAPALTEAEECTVVRNTDSGPTAWV